MLRAEYDLAREDYAGAAAAVSREEPQDDEERLLFARLAARTEDPTRALEHFTRMGRPDSPRYAVARAEILADAGRLDEAKTVANDLLHGAPESVMANLALVKLTRGAPKDRITAADFFLSRFRGQTIAPRIEGQVHAVRARAYGEFGLTGKAREAADAGLARDGTNADLLLVVAEDEASRGQLVDALREVETVVASRPGNADSQAACVLLQLDLDRVTDAERVVAGLRQRQLLPELTPVLEGLVTVWGRSTPPAQPISPAQAATPLGAWLDALIAVQSHDPAADARVANAVTLLKGSPAPFERRLAARAAALAVLVAPTAEASKRADTVQEEQNLDPVAHVYLARFYESSGRRALAAQHFDRACELGPQLGLAWYEKGRFYQDARDSLGRSVAAWKTYLQLAPTGPRADRVAAALRRP
jgi:tetratricopeptide (TPR) repeat protein